MILKEIGIIKSPYKGKERSQNEKSLSRQIMLLEIKDEFFEGLENLIEGQFIVVIYWADRAQRNLLKVVPPGKIIESGVFATRSQNRPNPLSINVVKILAIEKKKIIVTGLDALDNSPLLDIKPYYALLDEAVEVIEMEL